MNDTQRPNEPTETVSVTLALPGGLLKAYDGLVESGIYPDRESALLHGLVESWRHAQGTYYMLRLDLDCREDQPGAESDPGPVQGSGGDARGS